MRLRFVLPAAMLLTVLVLLLAAAEAHGGTYLVRQCHHSAPQNHAHEATVDVSPNPGPYAVAAGPGVCAGAANEYAIQSSPTGPALHGQYGLTRFIAPEGTKIVGVELDARLRGEAGHRARLAMANAAGGEQVRFAVGGSGPSGFAHYEWPGNGFPAGAYQQFTAGLTCDNPGFDCPMGGNGDKSKVDIRNVRLTLRDDVAPTIAVDGDLFSGKWQRGIHAVLATGRDRETGLRVLATTVNGEFVAGTQPLPCSTIAGTNDAARLVPCETEDKSGLRLDTAVWPFKDGANVVASCALDFGQAPNAGCVSEAVLVDNSAPQVSFLDEQLPNDPELIRAEASDATSGLDGDSASISYRAIGATQWSLLPAIVRSGELQARVDSDSMPPGRYEFRASVRDVAGNETWSATRNDGRPMVLEFPLKESATLRAALRNGEDDQVVRFRKKGRVSGRLVDEAGAPVVGETIEVIETFEEGSLIDQRSRKVQTSKSGRYRSRLPGGPSRDVEVIYEGSRRYSGDAARGLDFDVRGAARLQTSKRRVRAGRAVVFKGKVKRYFAQIPPGGKLVEIQVKSGNRWTTLNEAKGTNRKGKVRLRHRFRGFYTRPVTFTFRLKARRESAWPYRGAATSKKRRVTVVPK